MVVYADAAPGLAATTILLTTLALLTYGLRAYCRLSRRSWGAEDWIMTAALVRSTHRHQMQSSNVLYVIGPILRAGRWMSWGSIQWNWRAYYYPC